MAAILRFVPYVGIWIAALFSAMLGAAVDPGWSLAIESIGLFIIVELIAGQLIEPQLYSASAEDVLGRLRKLPGDVSSVMVIGHNPTLQMLVLRLARRDGDGAVRSAVERKFPTGALATLTFECDWSELAAGSAHLAEFLTPKGLSATSRAG